MRTLTTGETVAVYGVMGLVGLLLITAIVSGAEAAKELTEDLVYEQNVGPLHVVKVWEGEFSVEGLGPFQKYHWRLYDLDDDIVAQGYADTLDKAVQEAEAAVPG